MHRFIAAHFGALLDKTQRGLFIDHSTASVSQVPSSTVHMKHRQISARYITLSNQSEVLNQNHDTLIAASSTDYGFKTFKLHASNGSLLGPPHADMFV